MATASVGYITGHLYATVGIDDEDGITPHLYTTVGIGYTTRHLYVVDSITAPIYMDGAGGNDGEDGIDNVGSSVKVAVQP